MRGKRWQIEEFKPPFSMDYQGAAGTSGGDDRYQGMQIQSIERAAYTAVLKAFRAQSDSLTWAKESVMTDLRTELKISDDEHTKILAEINADEVIRSISESRANMKRDSTSRVYGQPSFTNTAYQLTDHGSSKSSKDELSRSINDTLIGRKLMIRLPGESNFNEAVITEHDPRKGRHLMVFRSRTRNETSEWVNINEVPRENMRWRGSDPLLHRANEATVRPQRERPSSSMRTRPSGNAPTHPQRPKVVVEVYSTGSMVEQVEKVLNEDDPDEGKLDEAKKLLKEQIKMLNHAIKTCEEFDKDVLNISDD